MFNEFFKPTKNALRNRRKLIGQKPPLKLKEIWAIRVRLQLAGQLRNLALFNLAIDSKLRACDLVKLRVQDVCHSGRVAARAIVMLSSPRSPSSTMRIFSSALYCLRVLRLMS